MSSESGRKAEKGAKKITTQRNKGCKYPPKKPKT